jgi:hypothetical protein
VTRWEYSLDPASTEAILTSSASQQPQARMGMDVLTANTLKRVKQRAGWLEPQTQMALARANASDATIDAAARLKAKQIVEVQGQSSQSFPSKFKSAIMDNVKSNVTMGYCCTQLHSRIRPGCVSPTF